MDVVHIFLNLLAIYLVIGIHEYGHYIAFRRNGIIPKQFYVGVGPKLFSTSLPGGTVLSLRPFPIAGAITAEPEECKSLSTRQEIMISFWGPWYNILSAVPVGVLLALYYDPFNTHWLGTIILTVVLTVVAPLVIGVFFLFALPYVLWDTYTSVSLGEISSVDVITATSAGDVTNPIMISISLFYFASVLVAGMNLTPISFLDGGKILRALVHKRFPVFWGVYSVATTPLLALLLVWVMANDGVAIWRLFF